MDALRATVGRIGRVAIVGILTALLASCGLVGTEQSDGEANAAAAQRVREWFDSLQDPDDRERGYELLHPSVRAGLSLAEYLLATNGLISAEWRLRDQTDREASEAGEWFSVFVDINGGSSALPAGLVERNLIQPHTVDGVDVGVAVIVKADNVGYGVWQPLLAK